MKKILSSIFVVALLMLGVVTFSACGNGQTGDEVYLLIKTQMEVMQEECSPFVRNSSNGLTSNYMLDNFYKKADNSTMTDYGWQDELIALGLNYVEKYYPYIQSYTQCQDVANLTTSLEQLNESYKILKEEYQSVSNISRDEDMTIYNGFIAKYGETARIFSGKVYDFATNLQTYLSKYVITGEIIEGEEINQFALEFYIDSTLLEIYHDYEDFLMINCQASTGEIPQEIISLQAKSIKTDLSKQEILDAKEFLTAFSGERTLTYRALDNFSYYEYTITYNSDVTAYEKVLPLAEAYLKQIKRYFINSDNFMEQTYSYLIANIFE
ncbi:MAG: hypothetical protein IJZ62_04565 [Clostridia bacterium]|nr:hypothetical protein [Clostridia bacterium]